VTVADARTLVVTPWEKRLIPVIEKAIMTSDLGLNPATSSDVIRVPLPMLTEERRKDLIKVVRNEAETARVSIRNVRRDANTIVKDALKNKEIAEDEERRMTDAIQKLTDKFIAEVDHLLSAKETDLMAI
jgi:ribosome recycling factor